MPPTTTPLPLSKRAHLFPKSSCYLSDINSHVFLKVSLTKDNTQHIFFLQNTHYPITKQLNLPNSNKKVINKLFISTWIPLLSKCLKSIGLIKNLDKISKWKSMFNFYTTDPLPEKVSCSDQPIKYQLISCKDFLDQKCVQMPYFTILQ